jgi:hypothetical protein
MDHYTNARHRTAIAAALTALVTLAGCNGGSDAGETTSPVSASTDTGAPGSSTTSSTTTSTSTSTTSTSTTLLTVTSPPTAPTTGGPVENEDFVVVIQALLDLRDAINAAPDPARASEVYAGGPRLFTFEEQLTNAQAAGQRVVDKEPAVVLSADVTSVNSVDLGEAVDVVVVQQYPKRWGRIVDAAGNTVFDLVPDPAPTEPNVEVRYTLLRPAGGGPWRIAFIDGE